MENGRRKECMGEREGQETRKKEEQMGNKRKKEVKEEN